MDRASYNRVQYGLIFALKDIHAHICVENTKMDIHSITIGNLWMVEIQVIKKCLCPFLYLPAMNGHYFCD